jgi:hypothetical protein
MLKHTDHRVKLMNQLLVGAGVGWNQALTLGPPPIRKQACSSTSEPPPPAIPPPFQPNPQVGIRVLKMYAWEAAQEAAVLEVRRKELGELRKAIPLRVGLQSMLFAAPTLAMVACFAVYGSGGWLRAGGGSCGRSVHR